MSNLSVYICFLLLFLGLSKNVSIHEAGSFYVAEKTDFAPHFSKGPISVLLIDAFNTGHLIKTYYQRYRVVYDYHSSEVILVRTSKEFYIRHLGNIGLSIYRRTHNNNEEEFTPLPPTALFVGHPAYGHWSQVDRHDQKRSVWQFYRSYQHLQFLLGPPPHEITFYFQELLESKRGQHYPYYGPEKEFGTKGSLTKEMFPDYFNKKESSHISWIHFLQKSFDLPKVGFSL